VIYLAFLFVPLAHFVLQRTTVGLKVRAVGEYPLAAETVGVNVRITRYLCILLSGVGAGLGGAFLSVGQLARFTDNMIGGRGFIALAIVIFGQWKPYRTAVAALVFAAADALQLSLQAVGLPVPSLAHAALRCDRHCHDRCSPEGDGPCCPGPVLCEGGVTGGVRQSIPRSGRTYL